uniref:Uncharacterized protein n=1 Tax=Octopus bimaculoides TaxID=37653 RepID=A0A0L8G0B0_OCTBM
MQPQQTQISIDLPRPTRTLDDFKIELFVLRVDKAYFNNIFGKEVCHFLPSQTENSELSVGPTEGTCNLYNLRNFTSYL